MEVHLPRVALAFVGICMCTSTCCWSFSIRPHSTLPLASKTELNSIPSAIDTIGSGLASIVRLPSGTTNKRKDYLAEAEGFRITRFYNVENDPKCRIVREVITELDLTVEKVIPSAPNSQTWERDPLLKRLTKTDLPILVVAEYGKDQVLSGVNEILSYFEDRFDEYRISNSPAPYLSDVATYFRQGRGTSVSAAALPSSYTTTIYQPLILYDYENNQFCRLVREVLTELDLTYKLETASKKSPRRDKMAEITGGSTQCPFLIDPNTNKQMFESKDIIFYLYKQYAKFTPPPEFLESISKITTPLLRPIYNLQAPIQAGTYDANVVQVEIELEVQSAPVVIYTYSLSPFCTEAKTVLDRLEIPYTEISLGREWLPFLMNEGGSEKRAELGKITGQTSLPHIFVGGKSLGGLYSGSLGPGLIPALEKGEFWKMAEQVSNRVLKDIL